MLRAAVVVIAAFLTCVGIALVVHGVRTPGWQLLGIGLAVLLGTLFERWRYRAVGERPNGPWQSTRERFLDPSSGEKVDVLFNPRTGERRYVRGESQRAAEPPP
jgi:hypothetical protein